MRTDQKLLCLKTFLTIFLCLCWLADAAVFGVLLWLRLDFWTNEYLEVESRLDRYLILIYIALSAGAVGVTFSIFGLIGGCLKKNWMLVIYLISLLVAIALTIAAFVYGIIYREELKDTLLNGRFLEKVITDKYTTTRNDRITRVVDIMQSELECCGADNALNYESSNWRSQIQVEVPTIKTLKVAPATCFQEFEKYGHQVPYYPVYKENSVEKYTATLWRTGCNDALQKFLDDYIIVVISIAGVFFVLQVICMIICSCFIFLLKHLYVPQPDDIVYDMAHNQEKSPYPSRGDYRDYYH